MPTPTITEDLSDGLQLSQSDDGTIRFTRVFFCADMPGANPKEVFTAPLLMVSGGLTHTGADIPNRWDLLTVRGINFWCKGRSISPWPPNDAVLTATYDTVEPPVAGFGPTIVEVGSTLEQDTTVFDAANQILAWGSRAIIVVNPPSAHSGEDPQYPAVPILVPKPTIVITRETSTSPESDADTHVGRTNSVIWRGYAVSTVLCLSIVGRNSGDGIWSTTYSFARDPLGKFVQIARWKDAKGLYPALTVADVSARAGIKDVVVQGSSNFNLMSL